jgi:DNA-binding transcriptional ArsR family regulator
MSKLSSSDVKSLASVFRTLADGTRLRILALLHEGEMNVTQLCKKLRMPQPNVSRHLGILRNAGLVNNRREGKEVFYSLADLTESKTTRAMESMMKKSSVVRMGPVVMGLARQR